LEIYFINLIFFPLFLKPQLKNHITE